VTNDLTICIPYGNYHANVVMEAIASAEAQTVPCDIIVIADPDSNGAGHTRNRALEQVKSTYVTFLDADDVLDPRFAESCLKSLAHYALTHTDVRYAYTDWLVDGAPRQAPLPCDTWVNGLMSFHLVNAVVPTERARLIGGFDENMSGVEDADFFIRLRLSGVCGLHIHAPHNLFDSALVSYRAGGQRSIQARESGQETLIQQYMLNRYREYNLMGCCGDSSQHPTTPTNEPQDGDILAQALWQGNRTERGRTTGRLYPRTSFPKMLYVNEGDVNAAPHLWKRIMTPMQAANGVVLQPAYKSTGNWTDIAQSVANAMFGAGAPAQPVANPIEYKSNVTGRKKADVIKSAQEWVKVEGDLE
jgi:hypothetical protein